MACDQCTQQFCCAQVEACFNNTVCAGLQECVTANCSGSPNVSQCGQQFCSHCLMDQSALNLANAIPDCLQANCATVCS